jgi:hypothetical protein
MIVYVAIADTATTLQGCCRTAAVALLRRRSAADVDIIAGRRVLLRWALHAHAARLHHLRMPEL